MTKRRRTMSRFQERGWWRDLFIKHKGGGVRYSAKGAVTRRRTGVRRNAYEQTGLLSWLLGTKRSKRYRKRTVRRSH